MTSADGILILLDQLYAEVVHKEVAFQTSEELEGDNSDGVAGQGGGGEHDASTSKSKKRSVLHEKWVRTWCLLAWKYCAPRVIQ